MPKGKPYPPEFKAKVVLECLQGTETLSEVAARYELNPNLVRKWKAKVEGELAHVFSVSEDDKERERELAEHQEEVDDLCRKIGELTAERDYLQRSLLSRFGIDINEDIPYRPYKHKGKRL